MCKKPKILFYDIETSLSKALLFSLGKQVIRHSQLMPLNQSTRIITIQYCYNDDEAGKAIILDPVNDEKYSKQLEKFDALIQEADVVIGKNNKRFDDKHLNTQRLFNSKSTGMPEWTRHKSDDLESHMRRNFNLLSYSLDYISNMLGLGGKHSMGFTDWTNIHVYYEYLNLKANCGKIPAKLAKKLYNKNVGEIVKDGKASLKSMVDYGIKDVEDTREIWNYCEKHLEPKRNMSALCGGTRCKVCGSTKIRKNGTYVANSGVTYQQYYCTEHKGYAGKKPLRSKSETMRN